MLLYLLSVAYPGGVRAVCVYSRYRLRRICVLDRLRVFTVTMQKKRKIRKTCDSRPVYKHSFLNSYPVFTLCFHVFCSTFTGLSNGTRFRSLRRGRQKRTKIIDSYVARFMVDPTVLTSLPRSNVKVLHSTTTSMGSMNILLYYQVWIYLYSETHRKCS